MATSLLAGLTTMVARYVTRVPNGYENEPVAAQRNVRFQRPLWEFRTMKILLEARVKKYDSDMSAIENRTKFVEKTKIGPVEYSKWLQERPANMIDLIDVAKNVLLQQFPHYLDMAGSPDDRAKGIIDGANLIGNLYSDVAKFEAKSYSIRPPEILQRAHDIQSQWTSIVRQAISQVMDFMEKCCEMTVGENNSVEYEIVFDELKDLDELEQELDKALLHFQTFGFDEID
ncbi:MAG: hypothetical protein AAF750_11335 [Planctomycetota bacterium]